MDLALRGKTAYITGGAQGIGASVATHLAAEGVRVAVSDVNPAALVDLQKTLGDELDPVFVTADLASADGVASAVDQVVENFGGRAPDIVVNNVALCLEREFEDLTDEAWELTFQLNFMSYVRTCRALAPAMQSRGECSIINMASDLAKQPVSVPIDYGTMKSAVLHLSKALAGKYAPAVRVNAVLPGPVWTGLWSRPGGIADELAELYHLDRDAAVQRYLQERKLVMGLAQPEDVATLVTYLASPLAKRINGAALDVGGTIHGLL